MRSGGLARFRTISKAVRTIQWAREHYTFTPVARTLCIVSTAQISPYTWTCRLVGLHPVNQ